MKGGGRTVGERESRKREGPGEERRAQKEEEDGCCMNCTVFTQYYCIYGSDIGEAKW